MRSLLKLLRSRTAVLLGVCGLALTQAACAHPVVVEPSVAIHARLGGPVYGSIYAPLYGSPPVVMAPQPIWGAPPPAVVVPSRGWMPHGHHHKWHGHGWDHGRSHKHKHKYDH